MEPYLELEQALGEWIGNPNVVVCSSGTAALHLALEALELPAGSEVLVPEFTMVACARAVTLSGLSARFVDCYEDDLLMDVERTREAVQASQGEATALMPVHVYGRRCDMTSLSDLAEQEELMVVEDLAEAHGIAPHPLTDAACWSFYRNKIVAGEEGGAVAFRSKYHAEIARQLRCLGFVNGGQYLHTPRGHNYRMSNTHASLILQSLDRIEENTSRREEVVSWYDELIPEERRMPARGACWVYDLRLTGVNVGQVVQRLIREGVPARCGFRPMSEQPEYRSHDFTDLVAYQSSSEVLYLPVNPEMSREDVRRVCEALVMVLNQIDSSTT